MKLTVVLNSDVGVDVDNHVDNHVDVDVDNNVDVGVYFEVGADISNDIEMEVETGWELCYQYFNKSSHPSFSIHNIWHYSQSEEGEQNNIWHNSQSEEGEEYLASFTKGEEGEQIKTFTCTAAGLRCSPACRGTAPSLCVRQNMNNYGI